jgi:formylglycine-generating enzyme required for sulfatase activity
MNHKASKHLFLRVLPASLLLLIITACTPAGPIVPPTVAPTVASTVAQTLLPEVPTLPSVVPTLQPEPTVTEVFNFELSAGTQVNWWDGSTIIYVPGGDFIMGDPKATQGDNIPAHMVSVDGSWIHKIEVTNRMYSLCVTTGVCKPPIPDPNYPNHYPKSDYANHPITSVTWQDAVDYCTWIGGRLPTEAEWEWSALGATGDPYPWGKEDPNCSRLNYLGCTPLGTTAQVGSYGLGLSLFNVADMAGNVFEWVNDWYGENYYDTSPAANPTGPESGEYRVIRSSSFLSKAKSVPATLRSSQHPQSGRADLGFRCIMSGEAVSNPPPPVCTMLSYEPIPRQPPSILPQIDQSPAFSLNTFCRMGPNGNPYGTAAIQFETGTDVANLNITSPQGALACTPDVNNPLFFNCAGSALHPGSPVTIEACNLQQEIPLAPQTCPCKIQGLIVTQEGAHIRVKWNATPQECSAKIFLKLQCDGVNQMGITLPGNQTELVIDGCPQPYTSQKVCVSCIDPNGNPGEPACSELPSQPPPTQTVAQVSPTCPAFYQFNPTTNLCEYRPIGLVQCNPPDIVVPGYGCLPPPQSGNCPVGYYAASYKDQPVCIPAGGPLCQGSTCPATCPKGLVFNSASFCCNYPPDMPPVCPAGYVFDPSLSTCVSTFLTPTGCTSISALIPVCAPEQPGVTPSLIPGPTGCLIRLPTGGLECRVPCPVGIPNYGSCTP